MRCLQEHNNLEDAQMRLIVDEMSKGLNLDHTWATPRQTGDLQLTPVTCRGVMGARCRSSLTSHVRPSAAMPPHARADDWDGGGTEVRALGCV